MALSMSCPGRRRNPLDGLTFVKMIESPSPITPVLQSELEKEYMIGLYAPLGRINVLEHTFFCLIKRYRPTYYVMSHLWENLFSVEVRRGVVLVYYCEIIIYSLLFSVV